MSATSSQPVSSPRKEDLGGRFHRFWQRVTDGLELNQLWTQFQADARASYRLYSREVDTSRTAGLPRRKHWFDIAKQFFWAILEKLSPARRILLLLALLLIIVNPQFLGHWDLRLWGGLLMFVLLILEVGDRVVMKRDLQIAREIQMWLLPATPPAVPGLEIAFATRPANTVAGDYYDIFARPASDGAAPKYLLAVADVAGKSIPAALLMATFQASLKTLSTTGCPLNQLVDGMNHYACTNSQGGLRFTTAFLSEYDPESRTLFYINAGHNIPILRHASGIIERLEAGGLPMGIREGAEYQSGSVTLQSGDWLVVFTDGLVEAVNEQDQEYGEDRLISLLQGGSTTAASKLLSRIMVDLDFFVGNTPQHDDVTCVLVRAA